VVDSVYGCNNEVIGPRFFRFKAEIDFNGKLLLDGGNVVVNSITEVFNNVSRALFAVFTDPDVLDRPICLQPLSAPVNAGEKAIDQNM
nr:metal tolerance protein C4 [Tanacetum cinerariifolium]